MSNLELEQDAGGRKASWHGGSHWAAVHEKEVEGQAWCWLEQVEGWKETAQEAAAAAEQQPGKEQTAGTDSKFETRTKQPISHFVKKSVNIWN